MIICIDNESIVHIITPIKSRKVTATASITVKEKQMKGNITIKLCSIVHITSCRGITTGIECTIILPATLLQHQLASPTVQQGSRH